MSQTIPRRDARLAARLVIALIMVALIVGLSAPGVAIRPAHAQDDDQPLTEEQHQWLERIQQALANLDALTNYTVTHTGSAFSELTLRLGGDTLTGTQAQSWQRTQTTFPGDPDNITAAITSTYSVVEFGAAEALSFGLVAEVRWVDGVLYVNVTPLDVGTALPEFPIGWIVVTDSDDYPELTSLQLDNIIDETSIFDDIDVLDGIIEDVIVGAVTLDDGAPADQITVIFNRDIIFVENYGLSAADQAQWRALFDSADSLDVTIRATIAIDADMLPVRYGSDLTWRIDGTDAAAMYPDSVPADTTLDLRAETTQESIIIAVNEALDPAAAPEPSAP
jgi:hypothetical protein